MVDVIMAQNDLLGITDSLFGVRPSGFGEDFSKALPAFKGMSATDIGTATAYAGGKQLGRGLMGAAGIEDPEMASANRAKQFAAELSAQGISMQSSQGMKALAQKLSQAGDFKAAQAAAALASNFETKEAEVGYKQAQTQKLTMAAAQEEKLRGELAALGPNPSQDQIMAVVSKYGSPDKILATLQSSQDRQDRLAFQREALAAKTAAEGGGAPGPVGKTGAYRNAFGEIIPGSEMTKQRSGFQKGEELLVNLNRINEKDIKNAESWIDWTSSEGKKQAGGKLAADTVAAQAKINAAQLLKQIESLPPGSASNADMAAAKSSFPGYGDAKKLREWVIETKAKLDESLSRQAEQYGFNRRVNVEGISPAGASTPKRTVKKFNEL